MAHYTIDHFIAMYADGSISNFEYDPPSWTEPGLSTARPPRSEQANINFTKPVRGNCSASTASALWSPEKAITLQNSSMANTPRGEVGPNTEIDLSIAASFYRFLHS